MDGLEQLAALQAARNGKADPYAIGFDDKKRLVLPTKPEPDDRGGQCRWLTAVFALNPQHPVVACRRFGGANGSAVLERAGTRDIHFNSYSALTNAARFREVLCGQLLSTATANRRV